MNNDLAELLARAVRWVKETTGLSLGGARRPLLVSMHSGAALSRDPNP